MKLYEINQNLMELMAQAMTIAQENGGELPPELESQIAELEMNVNDKIENYCRLITNNDAECDILDQEIKRLTARKKTRQNSSKWLLSNLEFNIDDKGFDSPLFSLRWSKSEVVNIEDESQLPIEFFRQKIEVDKVKVKKAIKDGEMVFGASIEQKKALRMKTERVASDE